MKYRKKPLTIEAFKLGIDPMPDWFCDARTVNIVTTHNADGRWRGGPDHAMIHTLEGSMRAEYGDWVIRGVKGELYPCKADIFEASYEANNVDSSPCWCPYCGEPHSVSRRVPNSDASGSQP